MATRDCTYFATLIVLALVLMWWSLNMTTETVDFEEEEEDFDDADDRLLRKMVSTPSNLSHPPHTLTPKPSHPHTTRHRH